MKHFIKIMLVLAFLFPSVIFAGPVVNVDLSTLSQNASAEILKQQKNAETSVSSIGTVLSDQNIEKVKNVALIISDTLREVCKTLNVEVNEFIKTPAGIIVTSLIVYKVVGKDFIKTILIIGFVLCIYIYLIIGLRYFTRPQKITEVVDGKKNIRYDFKYQGSANDRESWAVAHVFGICITTVVFFIYLINI